MRFSSRSRSSREQGAGAGAGAGAGRKDKGQEKEEADKSRRMRTASALRGRSVGTAQAEGGEESAGVWGFGVATRTEDSSDGKARDQFGPMAMHVTGLDQTEAEGRGVG